jgi:hypothetical protein
VQQRLPSVNNDRIAPEYGASLTKLSSGPIAPAVDDDPAPTVASLAAPGETTPGKTDKPLEGKAGAAISTFPDIALFPDAGVSTSAADLGGPVTIAPNLSADITTPGNATTGIAITTTATQRTDRIQSEHIKRGNTGRVELLPSTPVGDLKVNVRADITLPNPPLDARVDTNPPAGDGDRQFTTGSFNLRTTAVTQEKTVVVGAVGVTVDPSKDQPVRSVAPGLEIYQPGENNGLSGVTGRVTFSRSATDELYLSGVNVSGRVQLNASTDVFAGPNFGFSQPGKDNGGSVGATIGIVQRSEYSQNAVRQTTTGMTVAVPDTGGISITGTYSNGERNRFGTTDQDTAITVQYSNTPGKDSRFQIGVQLFNLP